MSTRRQALGLVLGATAMLALGAPAVAETLDRIRESGTIRVGVANERPYGYVADDGTLTGEAPTIARTLLHRIVPDIKLEARPMRFGELIGALRDGDIDMIAAGMFITPQRCAQITFTNPTYVVGESFAVRKGNPKNITDYVSISDNRDARVGLVSGTVEYNYALVTGIPADRALLYRDFNHAVRALKEGEVDAIGLTRLTAVGIVEGEPELEATAQFFPELEGDVVRGYGGFGFRKEDATLIEAFNSELDSFVGTEAHWLLVDEFGFGPDMAPDKTSDELCQS